jgi:hypothetical protein
MSKSLLNGCLFALLLASLASPALAAEAAAVLPPAEDQEAATEAPAAERSPGKCGQAAAQLPWQQPNAIEVQAGCTATYGCVHGTIVSCSSPTVGTCTSSGVGCGVVVCDGVATWCPGRCHGSHHCASFCGWNRPESYCDDYGCCVCVD